MSLFIELLRTHQHELEHQYGNQLNSDKRSTEGALSDDVSNRFKRAKRRSKATHCCPCCQHEMACVGITRPR